MIQKCFYKDRPAIKVESDKLIALFLPEDGGKMASLVDKKTGREFLEQAKGEKYQRLAYDGDYVESECSSWDDMFPTIDPCTPEKGMYKGVEYPDHGEVCRLATEASEKDGALTMAVKSKLFDVTYSKTVSPAKDGGLDIAYTIENKANEPFPYIWAGHCMMKGDDTARLVTSYPDNAQKVETFGPEGKTLDELPLDRLMGYKPKDGYAYKYYFTEKMPKGYFGLKYQDGTEILFHVDEKKIPYIGIWFNNGEFKDMYNLALECCTAPFDSPANATERGYKAELEAKEKLTFTIHISLERK